MRRAKRVFLFLAVLGLAFLGYYGTRVVYHARVFIELKPGDAVLGDENLEFPDGYYWPLRSRTVAFDQRGWFYALTSSRKHPLNLLAFDETGAFRWRRALRRKDGRQMLYHGDALSVSPSGKLFWIVHQRREDTLDPKGPSYRGSIVAACDTTGRALQEWKFRNDLLSLGAVGEQSAYLWAGVEPFGAIYYKLGKSDWDLIPFHAYYAAISSDGWIWILDDHPDVWDRRVPGRYAPFPMTIWRTRPGWQQECVCGSVLRSDGGHLPFWRDSRQNYYLQGSVRGQPAKPGMYREHKVVYRLSRDGNVEQAISTVGLLPWRGGPNEKVGRFWYVLPDGTATFDTSQQSETDTSAFIYRIYKAELMPRWRDWLLDFRTNWKIWREALQ